MRAHSFRIDDFQKKMSVPRLFNIVETLHAGWLLWVRMSMYITGVNVKMHAWWHTFQTAAIVGKSPCRGRSDFLANLSFHLTLLTDTRLNKPVRRFTLRPAGWDR